MPASQRVGYKTVRRAGLREASYNGVMGPSAKWIEGLRPRRASTMLRARRSDARLAAVAYWLPLGAYLADARHRARPSAARGTRRAVAALQAVSRLVAARDRALGEEAAQEDSPGGRRGPRPGRARRPAATTTANRAEPVVEPSSPSAGAAVQPAIVERRRAVPAG